MKTLFDQIFVVSLPSSGDRRAYIAEHFDSCGVEQYAFFDATSANDPVIADAYEGVVGYPPCFRCKKFDCGDPDCNNFLIPTQIATYLTYRRLWRHIVDERLDRVLIVEDDVQFYPHANRVFEWIEHSTHIGNLPFHGEQNCLLRLGWARGEDHKPDDTIRAEAIVRMANPCHAITGSFARALIERDEMISHTVDVFQHAIAPKPGEAFTIFPPIASELSWTEGRFESLIHPKAVHVDYLRRCGDGEAAERAAGQVAAHVKKKHFRPLLIVGHPRCGTGYAANVCQQLGLDVGHERVGRSGISSWMFAVDAVENPYALDDVARTRRALAWRYLVMPVRDIATAVGSVIRESEHAPPSYEFRRFHIRAELGIDLDDFSTPFERAVRSIVGWARLVLGQHPDLVFRIEDQHEKLRQFLIFNGLLGMDAEALHINPSPVNADKAYRGNRYSKPEINQEDWDALGDRSKAEVVWYCEAFGYQVPPMARIPKLDRDAPVRAADGNRSALIPKSYLHLPRRHPDVTKHLEDIAESSDRVFEFGADAHTLWWQDRVGFVRTVERSAPHIEQLLPHLAENVEIELVPSGTPISKQQFDLAVPAFDTCRRIVGDKVSGMMRAERALIGFATSICDLDRSVSGFDVIHIKSGNPILCAYVASNNTPSKFIILDESDEDKIDVSGEIFRMSGFNRTFQSNMNTEFNFKTIIYEKQ